jgi:TolA-binding protein
MYRRLLLAPLAAILLAVMTSPALALTLDDVKQMVSVGVPDNIIVSTVSNSEEVFNLTAEDIIALKTAGVSDSVIEALQATAGAQTRTTETRVEEPRRRDDEDAAASSRRSSGDDDDDDDGYSRRRSSSSDDEGSSRRRSGSDDEGSSRRRSSSDDDDDEAGDDDDDASSRRRSSRSSRSRSSSRDSSSSVKKTPKEIKELIGLYKDKKYLGASLGFYRVLEEGKYPEHDHKSEYYLADSLYKLGLLHSAQVYFQKVVKAGPENGSYFSNSLLRLVAIADKTKDPIYLIRTIHKIDPDDFPGKVKDDLYYYSGVADFERQDYKAAKRSFARLGKSSSHYFKARYYIGVIQNTQNKKAAAAKTFQTILKEEYIGDPAEISSVKQLAMINIARIYYAAERYPRAADLYENIGKSARGGEYWGTALYESAWAYFMSENREHKALGHLLTLSSPFFERDFIPDAGILEALTFYRICEFKEVQVQLDKFKDTYGPIQEAIQAMLPTDASDLDAARDLYLALYGRGSKQYRKLPLAVFARIEADRSFAGPHNRVIQIQNELGRIAAMKPQWRDAEIGKGLVKQLDSQGKAYKKFAGAALANKLGNLKDQIADLMGQEALLRFEMVSGEYRTYLEKFRNPETAETEEGVEFDFATNPDVIYWPFNGEFWQDELGYYERVEPGACRE